MNYFSPLFRKEEYNKNDDNYLSIDIGRGGDLKKYFYVNTNSLTGTDPDTIALAERRRRYEKFKTDSRSSLFKLNLIKVYFNDKDYIAKVTENGITKFSEIDCNRGE